MLCLSLVEIIKAQVTCTLVSNSLNFQISNVRLKCAIRPKNKSLDLFHLCLFYLFILKKKTKPKFLFLITSRQLNIMSLCIHYKWGSQKLNPVEAYLIFVKKLTFFKCVYLILDLGLKFFSDMSTLDLLPILCHMCFSISMIKI